MKKKTAPLLMLLFFAAGAVAAAADTAKPAAAAGTASSEPLDVTISGEAKDEIPLVMDPPPLDIPFKDVVGLSREGQRDRVLSGPVQHMSSEDFIGLAKVASKQTSYALPVRIPDPPYFQLELAPGLEAARWQLEVVNQKNELVHKESGEELPKDILAWDGYENGVLKIVVGPAYTPSLTLTDAQGNSQRYYGDPVQFDALQFDEGGFRHVEFLSDRLFRRGTADFVDDAKPVLEAALQILRQHVGHPFQVTLHRPAGADDVAKRRLQAVKEHFDNAMMLEPQAFTYATANAGDRGNILEILMAETH